MDIQLINCPACSNKCSAQARTCPNCGHPFAQNNVLKSVVNNGIKTASEKLNNQSKGSRNWLFATLALGLLMVSVLSYAAYNFAFNKKNLNIKAAVVYSLGGAQPVSRVPFVLLDADVKEIAKESGLPTNIPFDVTMATSSNMIEATKKHIISEATTDFEGKATFENVPTGRYTIHSIAQTRKGWIIWYVPVVIEGNNQIVLLDQTNAIFAD